MNPLATTFPITPDCSALSFLQERFPRLLIYIEDEGRYFPCIMGIMPMIPQEDRVDLFMEVINAVVEFNKQKGTM